MRFALYDFDIESIGLRDSQQSRRSWVADIRIECTANIWELWSKGGHTKTWWWWYLLVLTQFKVFWTKFPRTTIGQSEAPQFSGAGAAGPTYPRCTCSWPRPTSISPSYIQLERPSYSDNPQQFIDVKSHWLLSSIWLNCADTDQENFVQCPRSNNLICAGLQL